MSNCKHQLMAESFLQIENRRKEQHSELAVNKSSEATWFLSPFIRQVKKDIFFLHNDFATWTLLVKLAWSSKSLQLKKKAHSSVACIFRASPKKGRKSACSFVTSLMTEYKDKKYSLIRQDSKGEFATNMFLKMEQKPWLAFFSWKVCGSVVSSRFFGGALRDIPKNDCKRDYCGGREEENLMMVIFVCSVFIQDLV